MNMWHSYNFPAVFAVSVVLVGLAGPAAPPADAASSPDALAVNRGVVEIETDRWPDISVIMAEEIAGLVDDGATRRVLPVIGKGPLQALTDLRYLRGIDLAIVSADSLEYAREQRLVPGLENSLTYVTKLYNEEFHLLARADITSMADLANQTVNVGVRGSATSVTSTRLFDLTKINVNYANDEDSAALDKLRKGEIAAVAIVAAKPSPFLAGIAAGDHLHLLSVPVTSAVTAAYAPTRFTAADYPNLVSADQPADTIAVANVLMAADLRMLPERYRNVAGFVEALFTGFQTLLEPGHHPKWREVNIQADFPGWTRYPPAQQWLQRNLQVATIANPEALKTLFSRFVDERRQARGGTPMPTDEKEALFQQFRAWQRGQVR